MIVQTCGLSHNLHTALPDGLKRSHRSNARSTSIAKIIIQFFPDPDFLRQSFHVAIFMSGSNLLLKSMIVYALTDPAVVAQSSTEKILTAQRQPTRQRPKVAVNRLLSPPSVSSGYKRVIRHATQTSQHFVQSWSPVRPQHHDRHSEPVRTVSICNKSNHNELNLACF
ncbi:hypothetical protein L1887_48631 [Cichorium endivia]|nr:hypothetical protein L1887_48631 [Cichorium endivia]